MCAIQYPFVSGATGELQRGPLDDTLLLVEYFNSEQLIIVDLTRYCIITHMLRLPVFSSNVTCHILDVMEQSNVTFFEILLLFEK